MAKASVSSKSSSKIGNSSGNPTRVRAKLASPPTHRSAKRPSVDSKKVDTKVESRVADLPKNDPFPSQSPSPYSSTSRILRPIIQVQNLVKKYDNFLAVDNISFNVKRGEIFGILGPNGAGKTTTLEIIETLTPKTSGLVYVDGLDIDLYPNEVKKIIGVQLQSGGFYPDLNLVEILYLFSRIYDVKIEPMKILYDVHLVDKANSKIDELSGGQRQRFSVASTLVANPQVIFLDEPTTGLDPQARRNMWEMIKNLQARGKTIVLTTHYMDEAEALCDRIAIMDGGKILQINTVKGFIEDLLAKGFVRPTPKMGATMEDVFLDLTGKKLRE
jgi:ABC-2 type transport system ATP-binding protein